MLQDPSNPNLNPLLNISPNLPLASYIVAFLNEGTYLNPNWIATANSGAIFERGSLPPVPLPGALPLFATGLGLLGYLGVRKKKQPPESQYLGRVRRDRRKAVFLFRDVRYWHKADMPCCALYRRVSLSRYDALS